MSYDPFARGPHPVGVRTLHGSDPARGGRPLPVEVWYPADERHAGEDAAPETRDSYEPMPGLPAVHQHAVRDAVPASGSYPLVAFSHGFGGHRRQSTFLCTHLASHGYVVVAVDHTGNTMLDVLQAMLAAQAGTPPPDALAVLGEFVAARPLDVDFAVRHVEAEREIASRVDSSRIGVTGHSFGGWTALTVTARDARVGAVLALAPAGGAGSLGGEHLAPVLDLDWGREVPALFLVADQDSLLPLASMRDILKRTSGPKRMVVLESADHLHFCDRIEEVHEMFRMMPPPGEFARVAANVRPISELCPPEHAYAFVRGLGLAHFDAALKGNEGAAALLAAGLEGTLEERGIRARRLAE
jgi:dienelactone hydrolase